MHESWFRIDNFEEISSPALLVYPDRIKANIQRMAAMVGDTARLRPHVKTHKMAEVVRLQLEAGVTRFKAATIAEAEMTARAGAADVLLAYQPVGPNVERLARLALAYPKTAFSALIDDAAAVEPLDRRFRQAERPLEVLIDLDLGMHRTGITPGPGVVQLARRVAAAPGLKFAGLHAYDGHIVESDPALRRELAAAAFRPIQELARALENQGFGSPRIVAGGTPTFPYYASQAGVESSPGTCVFWDAGYQRLCPDMDFVPAAAVLTRVISKPTADRLCLDLGYKAISADKPHPRVEFPALANAEAVVHSEEHLVLKTAEAAQVAVGDALYGVPTHICPTCSLYREAVTVEQGRATGAWTVVARDRMLSI